MPAVFQLSCTVSDDDLDPNGHVNNVVYVQWMQDAAVRHSTHVGCTMQLYQQLSVTWVARSHHIDYLQPAFPGDEITVETWLAGRRKVSCHRRYRFLRQCDQVELARAETEWVYIDLMTGRPRAIHDQVINRFQLLPNHDL